MNSELVKKALEAAADLSEGQNRIRLTNLYTGTLARETFFATAKTAPEFSLDTLPSIRWQQDKVLLFGSVSTP